MNLKLLLVVAGLSLSPAVVRAQGGLFVNPIAIRISNSTADTGTFAFLGNGQTSRMFYGVQFGGYYDFLHNEKLEAGLSLRDSIVHGNDALLNNLLVGVHVAPIRADQRFTPYIEPVIGVGSSRAPATAIHVNKFEAGVFAGVDVKLNRHIDLRALEVGYGTLLTASSETIGGTRPIPSASLLSFSSGFVLRLP
jgi:hypothetical protein